LPHRLTSERQGAFTAGGPQEDGALLAHGTDWMSPYQSDGYFEYGMLDRA
jgi:hypothetical protein